MKGTYVIIIIVLISTFASCYNSCDHDLILPDEHNRGYNLTELGCLINGPWLVNDEIGRFNKTLFLNDSEITSESSQYDEYQKDLVFQLHKNGTITYWLKSENRITPDAEIKNGEVVTISKLKYGESPKKFYSKGFWKANFADSTLLVHFEQTGFPELNYKISFLSNASAHFQQVSYFDSLYNGNKVKMKKINTLDYRIFYPTL
jgi:hypothetical protein